MVTLLLIMMFRLHTAGLLFRRWYQLFMGGGGGGRKLIALLLLMPVPYKRQ